MINGLMWKAVRLARRNQSIYACTGKEVEEEEEVASEALSAPYEALLLLQRPSQLPQKPSQLPPSPIQISLRPNQLPLRAS